MVDLEYTLLNKRIKMNNKNEKYFDKNVVDALIKKIKDIFVLENNKHIPLSISLKEQNVIKSINPDFSKTLYGKYNGYGYKNLGKHLFPKNFNICLEKLENIPVKDKKEKKITNNEEIWIKRLSSLSNISEKESFEIAQSKIEAKIKQFEKAIIILKNQ